MSALKHAAVRKSVLLALDFDKTLTVADTFNAIASVAKHKHPNKRDFRWFTDKYMEDYAQHESHWSPIIHKHAENKSVTRSLMGQYLESLRQVENASLERIRDYKILAGVSRVELYNSGRQALFQPGVADVINYFLRVPNCHVCVISVNWSTDFIQGALDANGVSNQPPISVYCNDLKFSKRTGLSTGTMYPRLVVASDKVAVLETQREVLASRYDSKPRLVYAGDSLTDLPALLSADVGLFVGQNDHVAKWCKLLDVEFSKPRFDENDKTLHHLLGWGSAIDIIENS
ncbi:hypothetical protein GGH19_004292 [Coemansia sp. RSA 1807]|nr:hypothetical protein LPJ54_004140 [Coemansia sp. RSA 1824]KAJ1786217.1 hypothetical protein LPJ67_003661 [Coemansia sp. RSA 1938]KAJ2152959.1 hypothetical protein J3F82_002321 [Coemansia sp. RSA 637]KAJ2535971.1 hypothetical protein IWW43_001229 [Coemansia sp. RSA 1935]KAJ2573839.1 hypothetical protein GGH19_004292 [Coemansia sp. RSA 1807]